MSRFILPLLTAASILLLPGCGRDESPTADPPAAETVEKFPQVIGELGTTYYKDGPQQSRPPEGTLPAGTRVRIIEDAGSYVLIESESGVVAYVASGSIEPPSP